MNTFKKILAFTVCLLMLVALFASCDEKPEEKPDDTKEAVVSDTEKEPETTEPVPDTTEKLPDTTEPATEPAPETAGDGLVTYTFSGLEFEVPENCAVSDQNGMFIVFNHDYPTATDNLVITAAGADDPANYTEDTLGELYAASVPGFGEMTDFQSWTMDDGTDAVMAEYTVSLNGVDMLMTSVMLFVDDATYVFTFTEVSGEYSDELLIPYDSCRLAD